METSFLHCVDDVICSSKRRRVVRLRNVLSKAETTDLSVIQNCQNTTPGFKLDLSFINICQCSKFEIIDNYGTLTVKSNTGRIAFYFKFHYTVKTVYKVKQWNQLNGLYV